MRLVEVGDVPGAGLDPEAVDDAARGLKADASAVRDGGNDVVGAWTGLGASYEAPEAAQLLRVMDPVRADTDRLAGELERVASALARFAGELREIVTKGDRLQVEVVEFRARVAAAPVGVTAEVSFGAGPGLGGESALGLDPVLATQNAFLTSRIAALAEELVVAERACAAAVRAVDGWQERAAGLLFNTARGVATDRMPWGEPGGPESCAGQAIEQVIGGIWNSGSWAPFLSAYPILSRLGGPGVSPVAQHAAWAEAGRSLIGWGVSEGEGFVGGLVQDIAVGFDGVAIWAEGTANDVGTWAEGTATDVVDWSSDQVDALWQTGEDAVDWTGDRAHDVSDWVADRVSAGQAEMADDRLNAGESLVHFYRVMDGADDGGYPRTGEVLTAGLWAVGAHLGAVLTTATFGQVPANLLDDGTAYVGEPKLVPDEGYLDADGTFVAGVTDPKDLRTVFQGMDDAYKAKEATGDPTIRVTLREPADGGDPVAFVTVPGTEEWVPWQDNGNLRDVTADAVTASGGRSAYADAIATAMDKAQEMLPEGTQMVPVGHSLGGMALADVLSDPGFVSKHNITDAVVFGSAIDSDGFAPGVNVVNVQHEDDPVPKFDFGDSRIAPLGAAPDIEIPDSRWVPNGIEQRVEDTANAAKETFQTVTVPGVPSPVQASENVTTITMESPGAPLGRSGRTTRPSNMSNQLREAPRSMGRLWNQSRTTGRGAGCSTRATRKLLHGTSRWEERTEMRFRVGAAIMVARRSLSLLSSCANADVSCEKAFETAALAVDEVDAANFSCTSGFEHGSSEWDCHLIGGVRSRCHSCNGGCVSGVLRPRVSLDGAWVANVNFFLEGSDTTDPGNILDESDLGVEDDPLIFMLRDYYDIQVG